MTTSGETRQFPDRANYGCVDCGSTNHMRGSSLCPRMQEVEELALRVATDLIERLDYARTGGVPWRRYIDAANAALAVLFGGTR